MTGGDHDDALPTGGEPGAPIPALDATDAARSPLRIGDVVGDRYRIIKPVGIGGQGVVYQAVDTQLHDSPVAIKVLLLGGPAREGLRARFERESELVARLSHPHIVKVLGRFQAKGRPALVYDWVSGTTLNAMIEAGLPPAVDDGLELSLQIVDAVAYAHKHGVCHRDIKPLNVMVDDSGHIRLLDFGLGRGAAGDHITQSGGALGTYGFMAPEVLRGEIERDRWPAADVFALGVTLYAFLTGHYPFNRRSQEASMFAVLCDDPPAPSTHRADLPLELDAVILRMLEKEPADRYPDGGRVLEALKSAGRPSVRGGSSPSLPERAVPAAAELPFVGREAELAVIQGALRAAGSGHGRLVTIAGPPGIGKSRLTKQMMVRARQRGFNIYEGRAVETGGDYPYQALIMVLRDWSRRRGIDTLADLDRVLADKPSLVGATGVIAGLLALAPSGARDRDQLWETFSLFFAELAVERATLVVLEDMHAADQASLMLLKYLHLTLSRQRLCVAFVHRLEAGRADALARELAASEHVDRIELEGFSGAEVDGLAGLLVEVPDRRDWLAGLLQREASGDPLLINEICRLLEAQGVLVRDGQMFGVQSQPQSVELPEGFRNVVRGRLARLDPADRELLEFAAVVGEPFHAELIASVAGRPLLTLIQALHRLRREPRLVRVDATGGFRFDHARVRDVIYEDLPIEIRRAYHGAVVTQLAATADDESAALVAHHFEEAGRSAESVRWHERAAHHARSSFALDEAATHLERARVLADVRDQARLLVELGDLYQENGEFDRALDRYQASLDLVGPGASSAQRLPALLGLARITVNRGATDGSGSLFGQIFALIDETTEPGLVGLAHLLRSRMFEFAELAAAAIADLEAATAFARQAGDPTLLATASHRLGSLLLKVGRHDDARGYFQEAAHVAGHANDPSLQAKVLLARAYFERGIGEFAAARGTYDAALVIAENQCGPVVRAQIRNSYAGYASLLGEFATAKEKAALAVGAARSSGGHLMQFAALVTLIDACEQIGDLGAAAVALAEALTLTPHAGSGMRVGLTLEHGVLVAAMGDRDLAERLLTEVRGSANPLLAGAASYALGMIAVEHDDPAAESLLTTALEIWSPPGDAIYRARALAALARLRARDDPDAAHRLLDGIAPAASLSMTVRREAAFARGVIAAAQGELDASQQHYQSSLTLAREQAARLSEIEILIASAALAVRRGFTDRAGVLASAARSGVGAIADGLTAGRDRQMFQARPLFATLAP